MAQTLGGFGEVLLGRVVARLSLRALSLGGAVRAMELLGTAERLAGPCGGDGRGGVGERVDRVQALTERWLPRRGVLGGRCLERSLVRHAMLRARGVSGAIRIGVSMEGGTLKAHAWNMLDNRVLFREGSIDRWTPIYDSRRGEIAPRDVHAVPRRGGTWQRD